MAKSKIRRLEGDDIPQIFLDIRLRRTIGSLPPLALSMWLGLKAAMFLASLAGVVALTILPDAEVGLNLRIALSVVLVWLFYEHVLARRHYGVSHILATTKGVLFSDENIYVRWEDIESYKAAPDLLRFRPAPGHGPKGLFAPKELDIPLNDGNRDHIVELFRDNGVKKWKPE